MMIKSFTDSFHAMVVEMDKSYILKKWKEIDLFALEEKYMPLVEEAEEQDDPAKFDDAVTMFCSELHDGHVSVYTHYNEEKYTSSFEYHDYGLAMIRLDSGEFIAVCTDEAVQSLGITDGTIITHWDGKPVLQAAEEYITDESIPVKANADKLASIDLSAKGGETVDVTFIDSSGRVKNVTLPRLENEHTLGDAYDAFSHLPDDISKLYFSNFNAKMLDDRCGYLALTALTTGNSLRDELSFYTDDQSYMKRLFKRKLGKLKEQGMECLVIDMRNNMGGYDEVGIALCELLTNDDLYASSLGKRENGKYISLRSKRIHGSGEFADLKVVVLTNFTCISGGDVVAKYLSSLSNVTLAGITDPNGSGQMAGGCCVLADGLVTVNYPIGLTLDLKGEPNIDTRADRVSRDPVDVRIPLDRNAAMWIFCTDEDYELNWAKRYIENKL